MEHLILMSFTTFDGTVYVVDDLAHVRRTPAEKGPHLRRDGEWLDLLAPLGDVILERPVTMFLDVRGDGISTLRVTSDVTYIWRA